MCALVTGVQTCALPIATAARTSCLNAASLISSPSCRSIARRVFPSRLALKSFFGSSTEAPRAKVSFTACLYDSPVRSEEHTSELQSLMRISYAVFCLKKKNQHNTRQHHVTKHKI